MKQQIKKIIDNGFWRLAMALLWLKQGSDKLFNLANLDGRGQFWVFSRVEPSNEKGAELGKANIQLLVDGLEPKQIKEIAIAVGGVALGYEKKLNKPANQEAKEGEIIFKTRATTNNNTDGNSTSQN